MQRLRHVRSHTYLLPEGRTDLQSKGLKLHLLLRGLIRPLTQVRVLTPRGQFLDCSWFLWCPVKSRLLVLCALPSAEHLRVSTFLSSDYGLKPLVVVRHHGGSDGLILQYTDVIHSNNGPRPEPTPLLPGIMALLLSQQVPSHSVDGKQWQFVALVTVFHIIHFSFDILKGFLSHTVPCWSSFYLKLDKKRAASFKNHRLSEQVTCQVTFD